MKGGDWFELLPADIKDLVMINTRESLSMSNINWLWDQELSSMWTFIGHCFVWHYTPEGHAYWSDIASRTYTTYELVAKKPIIKHGL